MGMNIDMQQKSFSVANDLDVCCATPIGAKGLKKLRERYLHEKFPTHARPYH